MNNLEKYNVRSIERSELKNVEGGILPIVMALGAGLAVGLLIRYIVDRIDESRS